MTLRPSGRRRVVSWMGWGLDVWLGWTYLTVVWRPKPLRVYLSRDGTPQRATRWLVGRESA